MARLWVMSDLHLEKVRFPDEFKPTRPDFDVLVTAGDIFEGDSFKAFSIVARLAGGKPAIALMGNHEYWHGVHHEERETAQLAARHAGVHLLDDSEVTLGGVRFLGATLWADGMLNGIPLDSEDETGEMIDVAHVGGHHLITVGDQRRLHRRSRQWLAQALGQQRNGTPVAVITHHAPLPECLPHKPRRPGDAISASDLSELTDGGLADLWLHGHIHVTAARTRPGGTRVISNAAGRLFENYGFDESLVVEVG